jgi:hypothetical protein
MLPCACWKQTAPPSPWPSPPAPAKAPASPSPQPSRPSTTAPRPPTSSGCSATWPATPPSPPPCALLSLIRPVPPTTPIHAEGVSARSPFEKLLEASEAHPDLAWFFADWVDADKGLPDLTIEGVFPTSASAGNWLVAVNVANAGYAAADVPSPSAPAPGSDARSVTQRLRVPARGKAVQRILIQGKPTEVQVNDGTVPETQASIHITKLCGVQPANSRRPTEGLHGIETAGPATTKGAPAAIVCSSWAES